MKKKLLFIVLFVATLFGFDLLVGAVTRIIVANAPETQYNLSNTIQTLFHKRSDILILGASRAHHSFDPRIIEKETHLSCFNGGRSGVKMDYFALCVDAYLERCTPKIIILDVSPDMMESPSDDLYKNLKCLYGISKPLTAEMDSAYSPFERWKLKSALYRNNRLFNEVLQLCLSQRRKDLEGYQPLEDRNYQTPYMVIDRPIAVDSNRLAKLDGIVEMCKSRKVNLLITYAPTLRLTKQNGCSQWLHSYCSTRSIPCYDYSWEKRYYLHPKLFKDEVHLNSKGAEIFTREFCVIIRKQLQQ